MSSDGSQSIKPLLAPMFIHPSEDPDTGEGFVRPYPPMVLVLQEIRPPFWWYDFTDASVDQDMWLRGIQHASRTVAIDASYQGPREYVLFPQEGARQLTVSPGI